MTIYFLRHDGQIKIGFSADLVARVGILMATIPGKVDFIGHMPGGRDVEAHLHKRFADIRVRGEWFVATSGLEQWIAVVAEPALPELANTYHEQARIERDADWETLSSRVRKAAAFRWPEHNHKQRKAALADLLSLTPRRARSLYDCQPGCNLRASEAMAAEERLLKPFEATA